MNRMVKKITEMRGLGTVAVLYAMLCVVTAAFLIPKAIAQSVAVSEVTGYVTDPSGLPVAGAVVTMVETGKNEAHTTRTDARTGRYLFPDLKVGAYQLTVSAAGFEKYVRSGIVLQVASNITINVALNLGSVAQTVQVESDATMVETKDNSIAEVLDTKRVADLPLNGRNATQILTLTGAATIAPTTNSDLVTSKSIGGTDGSGIFSVAGSQANGLSYLLDGGDNNDPMWNINLPLPFPDALEEFSVQTTALPAQYGLRAGGVVNAVTKSGSNAYHGDVFEFLRNGAMDAVQDGTPRRDSLKRSQFGGVLGGRIVRDKLFFFTGYQGTRQRSSPPSQIAYVATQAALNGNFSTLEAPKSAGGCLSGSTTRQLMNPATGTPFTGNQLPTGSYDPAAVALVTKYLPISTNPCGEVQYGLLANNPDDQVIGRVDYNPSSKQSMYARYFVYDFNGEAVFNGSNLLTVGTPLELERSQTFTIGHTYTFGANTLNSFHATFNRRRDDRGSPSNDISPTDLGVNMTDLVSHFIDVAVTNYFTVGCSTCSPGYFNTNGFQVSDDVNLVRGKHEIAFGGDFRRLQQNLLANTESNGVFGFNGTHTGDGLADLLLGYMSGFSQGNVLSNEIRQTVFSFYTQDTYHISKRLTVNLGLRWEPDAFPYDRKDRATQFLQAAFNAGTVSAKYPNAPAGLIFPGDPGSYPGHSMVRTYWNDMSPRFGLIYDPRGDQKQVIRAGFGLMHDSIFLFYPAWFYNSPFGSTASLSNPVGDSFSNPWANQAGGNPFPGATIFTIGSSYDIIPTDMKPFYEMQWNLNIQRKIGPDWLLQATYLGTKSVHLPTSYDINPSVYIAGSTAPTNQRRLLYLQNPAVGKYFGGIYSGDPGGNSKYDALLLSVQHGFARHFQVTGNYTWSHCISDAEVLAEVAKTYRENPYSRSFERGNCNANVASIFNLSGVAQSPGIGSGFVNMLARNWQISPIITRQSGTALNITDGGLDISGTGQLNDRPNQILSSIYPSKRTPSEWFNPAAFAKQAAGTFGNVHRNSIYGPSAFDFDASLGRTFHIKERLSFLFRVDAFNALNHPIWNSPITAITSGQFGQITTYGSPRILQLGSKLTF